MNEPQKPAWFLRSELVAGSQGLKRAAEIVHEGRVLHIVGLGNVQKGSDGSVYLKLTQAKKAHNARVTKGLGISLARGVETDIRIFAVALGSDIEVYQPSTKTVGGFEGLAYVKKG